MGGLGQIIWQQVLGPLMFFIKWTSIGAIVILVLLVTLLGVQTKNYKKGGSG